MTRAPGRERRHLSLPRYRARPIPFSFLLQNDSLIEERSGIHLGVPNGHFEVGPRPRTGGSPEALYFDARGHPDAQTHQRLHIEMLGVLFALDARMRPLEVLTQANMSFSDWERRLTSLGYGMERGFIPLAGDIRRKGSLVTHGGDDTGEADESNAVDREEASRAEHWDGKASPPSHLSCERSRRLWGEVSPSDWKRAVSVRLALLFERDASDPLIRRMSRLLSEPNGWRRWGTDPVLRPLRAKMFEDPWREVFVHQLALIAVSRWSDHHWRQWKRKGLSATFENRFGRFTYRLPKRPRSVGRRAANAFRVLTAANRECISQGAEADARLWAAAVWLAGDFITLPRALRCKKHTLVSVARYFHLTSRQVHYAAGRLRKFLPESHPAS
jgi:hypothetical protein